MNIHNKKFCRECQELISGYDNFCSECGNKLEPVTKINDVEIKESSSR